MKQIKPCLLCGTAVGKSLAYQASVEYVAKNFLTGEKSISGLTGHICPLCNKKAGYCTSEKKLRKFIGGEGEPETKPEKPSKHNSARRSISKDPKEL